MDTKKPSKRLSQRRQPKQPAAPPSLLSNDDLCALDHFCKDLEYEDMPFESWQSSLENLDLTVPLWLPSDLASAGGSRTVRYSRTVRDADATPPRREITTLEIQVPASAGDGQHLIVDGQGDRIATKVGKLIVVLKVQPKNPSEPT